MKTISTDLNNHLKQEVTTLCTCWKIVRQDGEVFGFTDHDMDIEFDDGIDDITYESETGYNRTAIRSDSSMSVDNLDVTGFLESERITENDLRNGLFDFAKVFIFALNWADPSQEEVKLRRGWFGEVVLNQNGMFETEIRGLHQALSHNYMESYQQECRTDFCSDKCKLSLDDYTRDAFLWSSVDRSTFRIAAGLYTDPVDSVGAYRYWRLKFTEAGPDRASDHTAFAEIRFRDQADALIAGGTPAATSTLGGNSAASARDGNGATYWSSALSGHLGHWQIDFGADKEVKTIELQARNNASFTQAAVGFEVYRSPDGLTWTKVGVNHTSKFTYAGQTKVFTGFTLSDFVVLSDPEEGAETYIGGTVKFTSGPNTGRTMEIIDFDQPTGLVTVFENFPYELTHGDELEIAQGCDKIFETCQLYDNAVNFRGEPHVPGQDEYMKYPDAHDS